MFNVEELKEAGCELLGNDGSLDWYYKKMDDNTYISGVNPSNGMAVAGCSFTISNELVKLIKKID